MTDHKVKLDSWKERSGRDVAMKFRGRCSCGDVSPVFTASGMVAQWGQDHVNRQPMLTKAIVTASAQAAAAWKGGQRILAKAALRDARVMAQQLRILLGEPPYREAEQLALDLYERARAFVEDGTVLPEEPRSGLSSVPMGP